MNGTDKISPDDVLDGYSARDIFEGGQGCTGFTYDDLIVLPGKLYDLLNLLCLGGGPAQKKFSHAVI